MNVNLSMVEISLSFVRSKNINSITIPNIYELANINAEIVPII